MPSSYTEIIERGCTFAQFVWRCARAYGALIYMREEPLDAPVNFDGGREEIDYQNAALVRATARLAEVRAMTDEQCEAEAKASFERLAEQCEQGRVECELIVARYRKMQTEVQAWEPPSPEHADMKRFMLEQIAESLEPFTREASDSYKPVRKTGLQWRADSMVAAQKDIDYHSAEWRKALLRAEERKRWLQVLNASVPYDGFK